MTLHPIPQLQPSHLDVVVYDIEIAKCIPDRGSPKNPALQYCAGWNDHANMGISVLAAYDTREGIPRVFCADNLDAFQALIRGRTVAGFNNQGFDEKVLAAHGITVDASYDLCVEVRAAVGEPRTYTPGRTRGGRKLDDLARVNLGVQKTMSGSLAPVAWQQGRVGEVIDYCLRDVMLTLALLERCPHLFDPVTDGLLDVRMPPLLELAATVPIDAHRVADVLRPATPTAATAATTEASTTTPATASAKSGYRDDASDWGG